MLLFRPTQASLAVLYIFGTGFARITVSFLLLRYSSSSFFNLNRSSLALSCSLSSRLVLTASSNCLLARARSRLAFPGVIPETGTVLTTEPWTGTGREMLPFDDPRSPSFFVGCSGRVVPSKAFRLAARSFTRSVSLTTIGFALLLHPFPGGGSRARAADAKADCVAPRDVGVILSLDDFAPFAG